MAMAEEEETRRLVGVGPATPEFYYESDTRVKKAKAKAGQQTRWKEAERVTDPRRYEEMKTYCSSSSCSAAGTASSEEGARQCDHPVDGYPRPFYPVPFFPEPPRRAWEYWLPFLRRDPEHIRAAKEVKARHNGFRRRKIPRSKIRAMNQKTVLQCLEWYNSNHTDDQYEQAPGKVTRCTDYNTIIWTHGNFVARRKHSGCFSFLHAPRTLFFFEIRNRHESADEVMTCTPIDEPVTEAYTFLGFPLGRGTRRHGGADCVCKTCYRQFHVPHINLKRTCACGDSKVEIVCKMCYHRSSVLHPVRGGFTFGQENFTKIFW